MRTKLFSAEEIITSIIKKYKRLEINSLHEKAYEEVMKIKKLYYENKISEFLEKINLPSEIKISLKKKMLEPVIINGKSYLNFFEAIVIKLTQSIQPTSGNIAELCAIVELEKIGLKEGINFKKRVKNIRSDIVVYYPNAKNPKKIHRIEVKNVSLRERGARGLSFDGDSLLGFFNNYKEFTKGNVKIIDELCKKTSGYCYLPPKTLSQIEFLTERFKSNLLFGEDMLFFTTHGYLPGTPKI